MQEDKQRLLYDRIDQIAQSLNLELVELKIGIHQKDAFLQVLADRPQGKISIEECTRLNRSIVEAIDKEAFFSEDGYSLEVSSPGLDRPLVTAKDFLRNLNAEVTVWLKEKVAGKVEHEGRIQSVSDDALTLLTIKNKEAIIIPIENVLKALLVI